jgi:amino acid adenylation domain-containing protein
MDAHAENRPTRQALSDGRSQLTYAELATASHLFAQALWDKGVRTGHKVAVLGPKNTSLIAGIVGLWRLGATFCPMDDTLPAERLAYMLAKVNPSAILAPRAAWPSLQALAPETSFIDPAEPVRTSGQTYIPGRHRNRDAYCMFTSGSTGFAKGVVIPHQAMAALFEGIASIHTVTARSRCLNTAPLFFDVSVLDIWFPLFQGASVRLTQDEMKMPLWLLQLIDSEQITHLCAVAPLLKLLCSQAELFNRFSLRSVQCIMTGADVLDPKMVQTWLAKIPGLTMLNGYGPTEATCVCHVYPIRKREPGRTEAYPIGKPLNTVEHLILNAEDEPCEPGEKGELLVAGRQLLCNYLGDVQETQRRTLIRNGLRYYRTGDQVECLADGSLAFHGRLDDEVKVSGYRVHLNEIRRVARSILPGREITIGTCRNPKGALEIVLIAQGTASEKQALTETLQTNLSQRLAVYMQPSHISIVENFPRLGSGKIDTRALIEGLNSTEDAHV